MKDLYDVIADTPFEFIEVLTAGEKLWKVIFDGKEYVGELGFKVFHPDWTCRNMQYEVRKVFEENVLPRLCEVGMHYCVEMADCFNYYSFNEKNKVALVLAYGEINGGKDEDKHCTNKLLIIREIPWLEMLSFVNQGDANTGLRNLGNCNTGNNNTGDCNTGNRNTGKNNTGNRNTGNNNTGNNNTGNNNTGDDNTGFYNTGNKNVGYGNTGNGNFGDNCSGDFNIVDDHTGVFCTEKQTIKIFDVESGLTLEQWRQTNASLLLSTIDPEISTEWVWEEHMTEEEKADHPDYKCQGGYLKTVRNTHRFIEWWDMLSDKRRDIITSIPGFDAAKFKMITGIDVNDPDGHTLPYGC